MGVSINVVRGCLVASLPSELRENVFAELKEEVLDKVTSSKITGVIIDLCTVKIMDDAEFSELIDVCKMIKFVGTESILVGLQPGVVAALVDMGVDSESVTAFLNLEDGLDHFHNLKNKNEVIADHEEELDGEGDIDDEEACV